MPDVDSTGNESFRQLIAQRGIRPRRFKSNLEAMEAVELMATTCELGDRVLTFRKRGQISEQRAESLLQDLVTCFTRPVENAGRVLEIARELREYEK